jgi:deferrochelatase/peroxidase EfeB
VSDDPGRDEADESPADPRCGDDRSARRSIPDAAEPPSIARRTLLAGAAGAVVGAGAATLIGRNRTESSDSSSAAPPEPPDGVPFWGPHQAGIATPAQNHLHFAAFDLVTARRQDVVDLLSTWTATAAALTAGGPANVLDDTLLRPPADTGEALGSGPAQLTITLGFGPDMFDQAGRDRFGLAGRRPPALAEIPAFPGDELDAGRSGGDLAVQACANDPVVAFHAVHMLARQGRGVAALRWSQSGFGRTSSTTRAQETPRNLMGHKDGTNNLRADDVDLFGQHVWVGDEGPAWMTGGSYLVVRRIRMRLEAWDRATLGEQEATIGRHKVSGAPLGGTDESSPVDLDAVDQAGRPLIPARAHIRLAAPAANGGARLLRRGYSFADGVDALGEQDAGLFFICYQRDPRQQFVSIQQQLAATDALDQYTVHTASAIFACPPGASSGTALGAGLWSV